MSSWRAAVESELGVRILAVEAVAGGCIAQASRLETSSGPLFCKRGSGAEGQSLLAEATGLMAMGEVGTDLLIPRVEAVIRTPALVVLLTEWVEPGLPGDWRAFGAALAGFHAASLGAVGAERFGFFSHNFIGATPQENRWMSRWPDFFRERRLGPQVARARGAGQWRAIWDTDVEVVQEGIAHILPDPDAGALLHGDLWSGNFLWTTRGGAAVFDPAVYFGDPGADLAMTELFGGFDRAFYAGYRDAGGSFPGPETRELYNLYHLVNHLNLFGSGYAGSVASALGRLAAVLR